jgi:excisionase family DNA binding protein
MTAMQEITQEIKLSDESITKLALVLSQSNPIGKKYLTVKEAAKYLNCGERALRGYMKNKKISYYKFNGIVLFKINELDRIIENNKFESLTDTIQRATNRGR